MQKHLFLLLRVAEVTLIRTDCWRAYNSLLFHGYLYETVNQTENFVDPTTGGDSKRELTEKECITISSKNILCEYLWRKEVKKMGESAFKRILEGISKIKRLVDNQYQIYPGHFQGQYIQNIRIRSMKKSFIFFQWEEVQLSSYSQLFVNTYSLLIRIKNVYACVYIYF